MFWSYKLRQREKIKYDSGHILSKINKCWSRFKQINHSDKRAYHHPKYFNHIKILVDIFETLIPLTTSAQIHKIEPEVLQNLLDELQSRTELLIGYNKQLHNNKNPELKALSGQRTGFLRRNCYFCSSPIFFKPEAKTTISENGRPTDVLSCLCCKHKIKTTGKTSVLSFLQNNELVHWSQADNYIPTIKYWNLYKESH